MRDSVMSELCPCINIRKGSTKQYRNTVPCTPSKNVLRLRCDGWPCRPRTFFLNPLLRLSQGHLGNLLLSNAAVWLRCYDTNSSWSLFYATSSLSHETGRNIPFYRHVGGTPIARRSGRRCRGQRWWFRRGRRRWRRGQYRQCGRQQTNFCFLHKM